MAPWTTGAAFTPTVAAWARVEAQIMLVLDYLDKAGPLDSDGTPRPATDLLDRLERNASNLRASLGLDPASLAKLLRDVGVVAGVVGGDGLAQLTEQGRRIRLAAEARHALGTANGHAAPPVVAQEGADGASGTDGTSEPEPSP
jgi:hypothetical protein